MPNQHQENLVTKLSGKPGDIVLVKHLSIKKLTKISENFK